jgi:mono/diheme cytochrome c family protein
VSQTAQEIPSPPPPLRALLAEFDSPGALVSAAERVRDAGYTRWDAHSPFPIHGIDQAMGIRPTRLPWVVLLFAIVGCLSGLVLQWWTNATGPLDFGRVPTFLQGYDYHISGKPKFSLPANVPVIFELTVLLAAIATVVGMLAMNNLPRHHDRVFTQPRFKRVTADRFFICVDAADPKFNERDTAQLLTSTGAAAVEPVYDAASPDRWPRGFTIVALVLICLALFPPLLAAKARLSTSTEPRIQLFQDMGNQERFKAQQVNPMFADSRELRPQVPGTVARGDLTDDSQFFEGQVSGQWATTFPAQVQITTQFVRRGQQRFNIYCAPCHGLGGAGDGIVAARAMKLETPGWVQPASLIDQTVREREHGHLFNTITNGIRSMPPYGDQIPPADRWAIIAYIRALQIGQGVNVEDVPREMLPESR